MPELTLALGSPLVVAPPFIAAYWCRIGLAQLLAQFFGLLLDYLLAEFLQSSFLLGIHTIFSQSRDSVQLSSRLPGEIEPGMIDIDCKSRLRKKKPSVFDGRLPI